MDKGFLKAGHTPTLFAAFLYFDISFMAWVLLGPMAVLIAKDLGLNDAQKGLLVAVPLLAGAAFRVVNGVLVDTLQPRLTGIISQLVVIAGLLTAWYFGVHTYTGILMVGVVLGVAGSSFAIALPLASRWYPPEHQGTAMGIAGAGNSGTVFAALFAPTLALMYGWNNVLGLACIPLTVALVVFIFVAKNAPGAPPAKSLAEYASVLKHGDAWWTCSSIASRSAASPASPHRSRPISIPNMGSTRSRPGISPRPASSRVRWCGPSAVR